MHHIPFHPRPPKCRQMSHSNSRRKAMKRQAPCGCPGPAPPPPPPPAVAPRRETGSHRHRPGRSEQAQPGGAGTAAEFALPGSSTHRIHDRPAQSRAFLPREDQRGIGRLLSRLNGWLWSKLCQCQPAPPTVTACPGQANAKPLL